jgi:predicted ATP-grasp superfamily ATP-dependent carboligase
VGVKHIRWDNDPPVHEPVVIAAFAGWNDAGDAATGALRYLVDHFDADLVGELDPEEFFDFTSTRPHVQVDDDGERSIEWPSTEIYSLTLPGGRDAVLVIGTEPNLRWRTFSGEVVEAARKMGCSLFVTLGAMVAEVPHSRPVRIVGSVTDPVLQEELDLPPSTYEGPTGIVGVLTTAVREAGLPTASLWAAVPTYVPAAPSPKAALALVEQTARLLGVLLPTTDLEIAASSYERQVSELVAEDTETADYVRNLEESHDSDEDMPGRSLVEEVERYLRDRGEKP